MSKSPASDLCGGEILLLGAEGLDFAATLKHETVETVSDAPCGSSPCPI